MFFFLLLSELISQTRLCQNGPVKRCNCCQAKFYPKTNSFLSCTVRVTQNQENVKDNLLARVLIVLTSFNQLLHVLTCTRRCLFEFDHDSRSNRWSLTVIEKLYRLSDRQFVLQLNIFRPKSQKQPDKFLGCHDFNKLEYYDYFFCSCCSFS